MITNFLMTLALFVNTAFADSATQIDCATLSTAEMRQVCLVTEQIRVQEAETRRRIEAGTASKEDLAALTDRMDSLNTDLMAAVAAVDASNAEAVGALTAQIAELTRMVAELQQAPAPAPTVAQAEPVAPAAPVVAAVHVPVRTTLGVRAVTGSRPESTAAGIHFPVAGLTGLFPAGAVATRAPNGMLYHGNVVCVQNGEAIAIGGPGAIDVYVDLDGDRVEDEIRRCASASQDLSVLGTKYNSVVELWFFQSRGAAVDGIPVYELVRKKGFHGPSVFKTQNASTTGMEIWHEGMPRR